MTRRLLNHSAFISALGVVLSLTSGARADEPATGAWPSFRGGQAAGVAAGKVAPSRWDVSQSQNIRWKSAIPGLGLASPIVWKDRIFLTGAVGKGDNALKVGLYGDIASVEDNSPHAWHVICVDAASGKIVWDEVACEGVPKIKRHTKSSHANSTPATDGKHVVAFFGSEGLYCYSVEGKLLWKVDLGVLDSGYYAVPAAQWEFGSSPVIHEGRVYIQCDVQKDSFLAAFDLSSGKEVWRTRRHDVPSWSTPTVWTAHGRGELIVNGYKHIGGYDLATGKELWKMGGGGDIPVPTPVVAHDLIFITSAHGPVAPIYAIRLGGSGDVSLGKDQAASDAIAWALKRDGAYMQTPIVHGDLLYNCKDNGVLTCYEAKSGDRVYKKRLGSGKSGFTASAVADAEKLFYTSEDGDVYVVKAGREFEVLATNPIGEVCMATPAIADGVLYVRGRDHLFAIGE
ncbi:MAG: Outer membrane protein assembly factor BamB [Phycisphaerae bacterium]|nr:Outer membrane protein assembly factor BamB [Phycisphaerae bacterium]